MTQITKTIGGDRLGSGNRLKQQLHNYYRSSFNQSRVWKSTMNVGTLIPCFKEIGTNGDSFDIDINALVKTAPTVGPIFGEFKMQIDMFVIPIRLYNGLLHNNAVNLGTQMNKVMFPYHDFRIEPEKEYDFKNNSLLTYLGLKGLPKATGSGAKIWRKNMLFELAYYDIFKNYYANKQERYAYYIRKTNSNTIGWGNSYYIETNDGTKYTITAGTNIEKVKDFLTEKYGTIDDIKNNLTFWVEGVNSQIENISPKTMDVGDLKIPVQLATKEAWMNAMKFKNGHLIQNFEELAEIIMGIGQRERVENNIECISLKNFPLENIDKAKWDILKNTGLTTAVSLGSAGDILNYEPYNQIVEAASVNYGGICVKTYQSDIFNSWLSQSYAANLSYITSISAVDTSSGSFTMDVLNMAQKVYNLLNRIAVSGSTYQDWQEAVWSENAMKRAESPIYVGGYSCKIGFEEVVTTANTKIDEMTSPAGTLNGKSIMYGNKGGKITIKCNEPSLIMGIASITPLIDYSQGNYWFKDLLNLDELHKPALDGIGYQDLLNSQMAYFGDMVQNGILKKGAIGKQPAWINYQTAYNETYGDFAAGGNLEWMCFNRDYEPNANGQGIKDISTYIDPLKYNYPFAYTDNRKGSIMDASNIWAQISFDCISRRKMAAKQIPNL